MARQIREIAKEIYREWPKPNFAAKPYLQSMLSLGSINDDFYNDTGASIVRYFLLNATSWRGESARRIKAELKEILKGA